MTPYTRIRKIVGGMKPENAWRLILRLDRDPRGYVVALHAFTKEKIGCWSQGVDTAFALAMAKKLRLLTSEQRRTISNETLSPIDTRREK